MAHEVAVAVIGLGYFSQFHLKGWQARSDVRIVAMCDQDEVRAKAYGAQQDERAISDVDSMLTTDPDIIDIIAPPVAHTELISACLRKGRTIICL